MDWRHRTFAAYCAAFFCLGLVIAAPGPSLARLRLQTHSSISQISSVFTARAVGYLLGSALAGPLFDKLPSNRLTCSSLCLTGALSLFIPYVSSVAVLGALLSFQGLSMGTLDTGGNVVCIWMFGEEVSTYMQSIHFAFGLGAFLSPLLVSLSLRHYDSIAPAFLVFSCLILSCSLWVCSLRRSPVPGGSASGSFSDRDAPNSHPASLGGAEEDNAMIGVSVRGTEREEEEKQQQEQQEQQQQQQQQQQGSTGCFEVEHSWSSNYRRAVGYTAALLFCYVGAEVSFGGYLPALGMEKVRTVHLTDTSWRPSASTDQKSHMH